jgi:two-component system, cell cycle sensor histidine kinase and response regulator CckA
MSAPVTPEVILIVEDNALVRKLVAGILEKGGFEVLTASSVQKAMLIEVSFPRTIHLLLSAVVMPNMCGPDLAKAMKERRPDMRVMLMSGYANGALLVLNYGWHFLKKPLLSTALLDRVKDVLGSPLHDAGTDHFDEREGYATRSGAH